MFLLPQDICIHVSVIAGFYVEVFFTSVIVIYGHLLISIYTLMEGNNIPSQKAWEQAHVAYEFPCIGGFL